MLGKVMKKVPPSPSPTPTSPQNGGGEKPNKKTQQWRTLEVLVTLTKWHEANSSQAFKDSQVALHMCIYCYRVYCYRGKGKPDPKAVKAIGHSQGSAAFGYTQQNPLPWHLYPDTERHRHNESWQVDATGYFSDQSAREKNVRGHWPKVSGFLRGDDSSSLQVMRGERARDHMAPLPNTHFRKQLRETAPTDDGKI